MITYTKFDLSNQDDFILFLLVKSAFLKLLQEAYGDKYFGDIIYENKINKRDLVVVAAFDSENNKMAGIVLIKSYEKLTGLAVSENYRNRGIATTLIRKLMDTFHNVYAEIWIKSDRMKQLFYRIGFHTINDTDFIRKLLAKQNDDVFFISRNNTYASYIHAKDKYYVDRQKEFILFFHP